MGGGSALSHRPDRHAPAQVLPADDVPVPVGRPAHRPLVHQDTDRCDRAIPSHARRERVPADRLRCLRTAGRERRDQEPRQPARLDDAEHREDAPAAAEHGRDVRLGCRGHHRRPRLLPLEPVAVPAVPGSRPRRAADVPGGLVPERRHPCPRAGRGNRPPLLALRRSRREARPRAMVPEDHRLRRRAAGLLAHRLARAGPARPDELDRAQRGRRGGVHDRPRRPPAGRRRAARLHDPARHALRRNVHGPRARASARREADGARAEAGRGGICRRGAPPNRDRAAVNGSRQDRRPDRRGRDQPGQRRAHPDLRRRLRPGDLRHGRDHGRARSRRARLRVRPDVRAAHPPGRRASRGSRRCVRRRRCRGRRDVGGLRRAHGRRDPRQLRQVQRLPGARRRTGDRPLAGGSRSRQGDRDVPVARLADQPPALLGHADPGHLLRPPTGSSPCPWTSCRCCCPTTSTTRARGSTR